MNGPTKPKNYHIRWHTPGCYIFIPGFFLAWFCMVGAIVYLTNDTWYELYPMLVGWACVGFVICIVGLSVCLVWLCAQLGRLDLDLFRASCRQCWTCRCSRRGCSDMCAGCIARNTVTPSDPENPRGKGSSIEESRTPSQASFIVHAESPSTQATHADQRSEAESPTHSGTVIVKPASHDTTAADEGPTERKDSTGSSSAKDSGYTGPTKRKDSTGSSSGKDSGYTEDTTGS